MATLVRWTPKATAWLDAQLLYWEDNDMSSTIERFIQDLDKKLNRLSEQPETGRATSGYKKIRFIVIDKRYHLFYRINFDSIVLLTFFDTRQSPTKRPY